MLHAPKGTTRAGPLQAFLGSCLLLGGAAAKRYTGEPIASTFTYDLLGNMKSATEGSAAIGWDYDPASRPLAVKVNGGPSALTIRRAEAEVMQFNTGSSVVLNMVVNLNTPQQIDVDSSVRVTALAGDMEVDLAGSPLEGEQLTSPAYRARRWEGWVPPFAGSPYEIRVRIFGVTRNDEGPGISILQFTPLSTYRLRLR